MIRILFIFAVFLFSTNLAYADKKNNNLLLIEDAFVLAVQNNPTLAEARASYFGVAESLAQAVSGYRPDISLNGNLTNIQSDSEGNNFITQNGGNFSQSASIDFAQPIFRGGSTSAQVRASKNAITAQHWLLKQAYQDVFTAVARAYWSVSLQTKIYELNLSNRNLLEKQLEENRARFDAGELTRTDVSQAKSRLARATADIASSQSAVIRAKSDLRQLIRVPVFDVRFSGLSYLDKIPKNVSDALDIANAQNPNAVASRFLHNAAVDDVDGAIGTLLPQIDLVAQAQRVDDPPPGFLDRQTTETIQLNATIPLYKSGAARSRARQAKYAVAENKANIIVTEEGVRSSVISAWEDYRSSLFEIEAFEEQVEAAGVALEGAEQEVQYGLRTAIDELDAQQELLVAEVSLVEARHNRAIAGVELLSSMGELLPENIGIKIKNLPNNGEVMGTIGGNWLGLDVDYTK